ncbi:uncharacterized [Tachysurus ichikawai]
MHAHIHTNSYTHQPGLVDNLSEFCLVAAARESEQHTVETAHVALGSQGRADAPGGTELFLSRWMNEQRREPGGGSAACATFTHSISHGPAVFLQTSVTVRTVR